MSRLAGFFSFFFLPCVFPSSVSPLLVSFFIGLLVAGWWTRAALVAFHFAARYTSALLSLCVPLRLPLSFLLLLFFLSSFHSSFIVPFVFFFLLLPSFISLFLFLLSFLPSSFPFLSIFLFFFSSPSSLLIFILVWVAGWWARAALAVLHSAATGKARDSVVFCSCSSGRVSSCCHFYFILIHCFGCISCSLFSSFTKEMCPIIGGSTKGSLAV